MIHGPQFATAVSSERQATLTNCFTMRRLLLVRTLFFLALLQGTLAAATVRWSPLAFPNPEADRDTCRSSSARICDPDEILNDTSAVANFISKFEDVHKIACNNNQSTNPQQNASEIQLAVALVNRMDLSGFVNRQDREDLAAEEFGTHLHNHWGVGLDSSCGGTGILIFLAIHDRAIYISRGEGVKSVLTDYRLNHVIAQMKPLLRSENYSGALQSALDNMSIFVKAGEPNLPEQILATLDQTLPLVFFASVVLFFVFQGRIQQRHQREYARVQSHLSELDRNRALALQGTYQCTSCPICLDDFQSNTDGNDSTADRVGSDGLPLKLLRCGHVFDQSCWTEWIEIGQGNFSQCPVCNQDVGTPSASDQVSPEQIGAIRQRNGIGAEAEQRALRHYQQERMFRLARMGARYPRFVNQDQVQRWSDPAHERSLVQDQSFVRSNPHQPKPSSGFNHGASSRSFGGGGSSGGRGGRW